MFKKGLSVKAGFTLIELLVVVAIIGLLASVIVVSLGSARQGARDARRASDIAQIRTALELYASSVGDGNYPNDLSILQTTGFIPAIPNDPQGVEYSYCQATSLRAYGLGITLEEKGSNIMVGSVALANMPTGCKTAAELLPNPPGLACEAYNPGISLVYCVSNS